MTKKKIGVTLSPELHDEVKVLATRLGMNIEEVYTEALLSFIRTNNGAATQSLSNEAIRLARLYDEAAHLRDKLDCRILDAAVETVRVLAEKTQYPLGRVR
jgi:hypothetical protein